MQAAWINETFRFTFYPAQVFSSEIYENFKNTFENTNRSLEHLRSCKVLFINCWFCNYIIVIWEFLSSRWRFFYGSEALSLLMPFSKESMKVKKASNLNLLDTCATLIHVPRWYICPSWNNRSIDTNRWTLFVQKKYVQLL